MKMHRWAWIALSLVGCATQSSTQSAAPTTAATTATTNPPRAATRPLIDREAIWYACSEVGGGFCERLALLPQSEFELRSTQASCERVVVRRGQWRVEGAALVLDERSRDEHVGGACAMTTVGPQWTGSTLTARTLERPERSTVELSACAEAERAASPADCVRFGAVATIPSSSAGALALGNLCHHMSDALSRSPRARRARYGVALVALVFGGCVNMCANGARSAHQNDSAWSHVYHQPPSQLWPIVTDVARGRGYILPDDAPALDRDTYSLWQHGTDTHTRLHVRLERRVLGGYHLRTVEQSVTGSSESDPSANVRNHPLRDMTWPILQRADAARAAVVQREADERAARARANCQACERVIAPASSAATN